MGLFEYIIIYNNHLFNLRDPTSSLQNLSTKGFHHLIGGRVEEGNFDEFQAPQERVILRPY